MAGTPTHCVCGSRFMVQHILSCPRGGFSIICHNELRDLTGHLLTKVCHVRTEQDLQPLTGETLSQTFGNSSDGARLDIGVNGFWGGRGGGGGGNQFERRYMNVRVFNPLATSNSDTNITSAIVNRRMKRRGCMNKGYEKPSTHCSPTIVFATTGEMGRQATFFITKTCCMLA